MILYKLYGHFMKYCRVTKVQCSNKLYLLYNYDALLNLSRLIYVSFNGNIETKSGKNKSLVKVFPFATIDTSRRSDRREKYMKIKLANGLGHVGVSESNKAILSLI